MVEEIRRKASKRQQVISLDRHRGAEYFQCLSSGVRPIGSFSANRAVMESNRMRMDVLEYSWLKLKHARALFHGGVAIGSTKA